MRPGNKSTVTLEQYRRILEWEQARRALPSVKQLARDLELPVTTLQSVLYKRARKNLNDQMQENRT